MDSETEDQKDQPPLLPISNWHDYEYGRGDQLFLREAVEPPTIAERAFVALSNEWRARIPTVYEGDFSGIEWVERGKAWEELALSCLLLSSEWSKRFTKGFIVRECEKNIEMCFGIGNKPFNDHTPWMLCQELISPGTTLIRQFERLAGSLSLEEHMLNGSKLEMAWIVRDHLPLELATSRLLCNLAVSIDGAERSAGLVSALYSSPSSFQSVLDAWDANVLLEDQEEGGIRRAISENVLDFCERRFNENVTVYGERRPNVAHYVTGWKDAQGSFLEMENRRRKIIETTILGLRYLGPGGPDAFTEGGNSEASG